jgi:hypothetical protein
MRLVEKVELQPPNVATISEPEGKIISANSPTYLKLTAAFFLAGSSNVAYGVHAKFTGTARIGIWRN